MTAKDGGNAIRLSGTIFAFPVAKKKRGSKSALKITTKGRMEEI